MQEEIKEKAIEAANFLKQLSNPSRLVILCALSQSEQNASKLAEIAGISQTALSNHLAKLRKEGSIDYHRNHRELHYYICDENIKKLINTLYEIYCSDHDDSSSSSQCADNRNDNILNGEIKMGKYQNIEATELNKLLQAGEALLIDVREADEFAEEHIAYAISAPLSQIEDALPDISNYKQKIVFQCKLGKRGDKACAIVANNMLKDKEIYNLSGGIEGWKEAGLPTITKSGKKKTIPIMRQVQIIVGGLILLSSIVGFSGIKAGFTIAALLGAALMMAGITGWCGMAILLAKMPWNR